MKRAGGPVYPDDSLTQSILRHKRQKFNEYQQEMRRRKATRRPVKKRTSRTKRKFTRGRKSVRKRLSFKKRRSNGVKATSQYSTSTFTKSKRRWAKWATSKLRDLRQIKRYINHYNQRVTGANGYQTVASFATPLMPITRPSVDPGTAAAAAIQKIWWEYIGSTVTNAANRNRYIYIENVTTTYEIQSCNEWMTTLDIYDYVTRRDTQDEIQQAWYDGLQEGQRLASLNPAGGVTQTTYRVTPYMSNQLCQNYKIIRRNQAILPAGTTHKHTTSFNIKKRFNVDDFNGQAGIYKRGFTHGSLFVGYGKQASDSDNNQEIVPMRADYIIGVKVEIRFRIDDNENTDQNIIIQSLTNPSVVTNPQNINPETGQIDQTMQVA